MVIHKRLLCSLFVAVENIPRFLESDKHPFLDSLNYFSLTIILLIIEVSHATHRHIYRLARLRQNDPRVQGC